MKKFTFAAAAAILASAGTVAYVASPAFAQMGGPEGGRMMFDRNATITWADAKARADAAWTRLDVNKDGKLDQADRDAKALEMFDKLDANHDGVISKDEFLAHHRAMMERGQPGGKGGPPPMGGNDGAPPMGGNDGAPPMGRGHGPDRHGMGHGMGHGPMDILAKADANGDGTITRAEYDAAVKAHFDAADANHDGKLTPEERRAAFMKMRGRDGEGMRAGGMPGGMNGGMGRGMGGDMTPLPPPSDDE